ncbi:MAG TPA: PDZ domain-containing protein [Fimbriimonadaceae bacterium]|nr:PDZ domain-containing protein [Fimbriimonadaceae bacterium]
MLIVPAIVLILSASEDLPRRGALGVPLTPITSEVASKYNLKAGEAVIAGEPIKNLTAAKAGIKPGDVIVQINDRPAKPQGLGEWVRGLSVGSATSFKILREGKAETLTAPLAEKPRDPGTSNYTVEYRHVVSQGARMRTITTSPTKPGRHPAMLFIQGFSPISYDYTLEGSVGDVATIDGPILFEMASSNFVTLRVEKPGVGDSEGGPFADMDFLTEADIYRQAMRQLREMPSVDVNNVFIFGHSMGGSFGPMIACEFPVRGLAVYGTAGRTWFEYLMDTIRYQGLVAGQSYEAADDDARQGAQLMALAMIEKKSPAEIKKSHPKLADLVDAYFPNGLFNGKTLEFWRQLNDINFAKFWAKCGSHVLAVRGESDFVTYDADHKLIADIVNRATPGRGKFVFLPNSDHLFHAYATEAESMKGFQRGTFNNDFAKVMKDWMRSVMTGG